MRVYLTVAKHFAWVIKSNNTPVALNVTNGTIVHSSNIINYLVSSSVWQAYVTFLVLDIPFEIILGIPWLSHICPVGLRNKGALCTVKSLLAQTAYYCK